MKNCTRELKVNNPIALCQLSDRADTCIFEDCPLYEKCYPEWLRKEIKGGKMTGKTEFEMITGIVDKLEAGETVKINRGKIRFYGEKGYFTRRYSELSSYSVEEDIVSVDEVKTLISLYVKQVKEFERTKEGGIIELRRFAETYRGKGIEGDNKNEQESITDKPRV